MKDCYKLATTSPGVKMIASRFAFTGLEPFLSFFHWVLLLPRIDDFSPMVLKSRAMVGKKATEAFKNLLGISFFNNLFKPLDQFYLAIAWTLNFIRNFDLRTNQNLHHEERQMNATELFYYDFLLTRESPQSFLNKIAPQARCVKKVRAKSLIPRAKVWNTESICI